MNKELITFKIQSIPEIVFAHVYSDNSYKNTLVPNKNFIEISLTTEGSFNLTKSGQTYRINKNDIICNLHNSTLNIDSNTYHEHRTVGAHVIFETCDANDKNSISLPFILTASDKDNGKIYKLIDAIIRTHTLEQNGSLSCAGLFLQLLNELDKLNKQNKNKTLYSDLRYVNKAKEYVFNNLSKPIKQRDIAQYLNISPEYLCFVFKKIEGISLINFVNTTKLEKIYSLMQKENVKLWQAAETCGYTDPNYVSRLYKKYFGMNITETHKCKKDKIKNNN